MSQSSDQDAKRIEAAFTEAWIKCMTEHDGNLVTGPCKTCAVEAGERLQKDLGRG